MKIDHSFAELLSGGACKGFYYVGYMKAREELGISLGLLEGVSVGSLLAGAIAVGVRFKEIYEYMSYPSVLKGLFNASILNPFARFRLSRDEKGYLIGPNGREIWSSGLSNTRVLERIVDDFLGDARFKDYKNLTIFGCDYSSASEIVFNYIEHPNLKIRDAVLTSATVPGVFPARKFEENGELKYTVDGGVYMNFPLDWFLVDDRVKDIVAIDLMNVSEENPKELPHNQIQMYIEGNFVSTSSKTRYIFKYVLHKNYEEAIREKIFSAKVHEKVVDGEARPRVFGRKKNILFINPKINDSYLVKTDLKHFEELVKMGYEECKPLLERFEEFRAQK